MNWGHRDQIQIVVYNNKPKNLKRWGWKFNLGLFVLVLFLWSTYSDQNGQVNFPTSGQRAVVNDTSIAKFSNSTPNNNQSAQGILQPPQFSQPTVRKQTDKCGPPPSGNSPQKRYEKAMWNICKGNPTMIFYKSRARLEFYNYGKLVAFETDVQYGEPNTSRETPNKIAFLDVRPPGVYPFIGGNSYFSYAFAIFGTHPSGNYAYVIHDRLPGNEFTSGCIGVNGAIKTLFAEGKIPDYTMLANTN